MGWGANEGLSRELSITHLGSHLRQKAKGAGFECGDHSNLVLELGQPCNLTFAPVPQVHAYMQGRCCTRPGQEDSVAEWLICKGQRFPEHEAFSAKIRIVLDKLDN